MTFNETGLSEFTLSAIDEMGYKEPTPIQQQAIPHILSSENDLIALAQTGTGKTAAFGLPILDQLDPYAKGIQAMVLCPTRELCLQITQDLQEFSKNIEGLEVVPVYGGADIQKQIRAVKKSPSVVVGTPGRVVDLIYRKALYIDMIQWMVLDEADEMLSMGFKDDLDTILGATPEFKQTLLFSATMPKEMKDIAHNYMHNPEQIAVISKERKSNENISHECYIVHGRDRYHALKRLADINPNIYGIVFCRTRHETKDIADKLIQDGYNADALHGDLSQSQRDLVMQRFRAKQIQMLVATDVAARGIDVSNLTHVINYGIPDQSEVYVHRSGRTGRAHNKGVSIVITNNKEKNRLRDVEKLLGRKFEHKEVPKGQDVISVQFEAFIEKISEPQEVSEDIQSLLPVAEQKLQNLSKEELIRNLAAFELGQLLDYYKDAHDLKAVSDQPERERHERNKANFNRYFINIGKKDRVDVKTIINLVDSCFDERIDLGRIDLMSTFSFFELPKSIDPQELSYRMNKKDYKGRQIRTELSEDKGGGGRDRRKGRSKRKKKRQF